MHRMIRLGIRGMTCRRCAERIREHLQEDSGIVAVEISLGRGVGEVQFDAEVTDTARIVNHRVFRTEFPVRWKTGRVQVHRYSAELVMG